MYALDPVLLYKLIRIGGVLPTDDGLLKFWSDMPFERSTTQNGWKISEPNWEQQVSPVMEKELEAVKIGIYGAKAKDLLLKDLRVCW
jgi:hypothetical protein